MSETNLTDLIEQEIMRSRRDGHDYCKLIMDDLPSEQYLSALAHQPEVTRYGHYVYKKLGSPDWHINDNCSIVKVDSRDMLEHILQLDLITDQPLYGEDFCRRRVQRRGQVYLSTAELDSYVCCLGDDPIGNCDLFIHNGTAKIEDFAVTPSQQRQGYGTSILKHLIDTAILSGVDMIYLTADEDDTAKHMYEKLGFEKTCETYSLLFQL
ncbi:GNAT family N-acetyltransferase [Paenibacillus marinisediminis]